MKQPTLAKIGAGSDTSSKPKIFQASKVKLSPRLVEEELSLKPKAKPKIVISNESNEIDEDPYEDSTEVVEWEALDDGDIVEATSASDEASSEADEYALRTIVCKPYHWTYEDHIDDQEDPFQAYTEIKISGHALNNDTVYLSVNDFRPYVYLQLPTDTKVKWDRTRRQALFRHFQNWLKHRGPLSYEAVKRKNLYFLDPILALKIAFRTHRDCLNFASRIYDSRGIYIETLGRRFPYMAFRVHEQKLDPILKFTAQRRLALADWFQCTEAPLSELEDDLSVAERKFTTAAVDARVSYATFTSYTPVDSLLMIKYKCVSFDIECYSKNHNSKNPDPTEPENVVFSIGCTFYVDGELESREKILLTLFDPHDQPPEIINEIRRFKTEAGLIKGFAALLREKDPDALITYNGMAFDWNYLIIRATDAGCLEELQTISRLPRKQCPVGKSSWSSDAYGEQNFLYLDPEGRLNIDVLTEIRRNFRLPKYNLGFVAGEMLGPDKDKDPISPRQLFMLYDLTKQLLAPARKLPPGVVPREERIKWKTKIRAILKQRWCNGPTLDLRNKLLRFEYSERLVWLIREALTLTGKYNIVDTLLPIDLTDKLGLTTTMEQTANTMQVPMSYLHTRGQQIKVVAQVHRDTIEEGIIIPHIAKESIVIEKYMGAMVVDVVPGNYDDILIFDFESLYPCMIITANICYTTLLKEGDPTPDDQCNIVQRSEHRGCEHDKSKKKVKLEDRLCVEKTYRFKKVIYHPDGTRSNEGIMPALERKLMASRKAVKRVMAEVDAKIKCATGKATDDDRAYFQKCGWETPEANSLSKEQLDVLKSYSKVLNARQLSLKVSANSAYGILGAQLGFIPFIPGASAVTAMGRMMILKAIWFILTHYSGKEVEVRDEITGEVTVIIEGKTKLVYGDTDSCLIQVLNLASEKLWPLGEQISKETTHFLKTWWLKIDRECSLKSPDDLQADGRWPEGGKEYRLDKFPLCKKSCTAKVKPECCCNVKALPPKEASLLFSYLGCPINLQIEAYYKRLILLTKKRYLTYMANGKGVIIGKNKKGVITVRRENCQWVKDVYQATSVAILDKSAKDAKASKEAIIDLVLRKNVELCSRQVKDAQFIMYKGIKTVISYAKKDKSGSYVDREGKVIEGVQGPLDERLVYAALAHVNLARKMIARGDDVPPNTRMEYVYLEDPSVDLDSYRTEDYTFFRENKHSGLRLDYFYYQRQLIKPLTELLDVVFPGDPIMYEKLDERVRRARDSQNQGDNHTLETYMKEIKKGLQGKKYLTKKLLKDVSFGEIVGWGALGIKKKPVEGKVYRFADKGAKENEIALMAIKEAINDGEEWESEEHVMEYRNLLLCWKSRYILNQFHKRYQSGARKHHMPANRNNELKVISADGDPKFVLLRNSVGKYPRGTKVKLVQSTDVTDTFDIQVDIKKKQKIFNYDVETPNGKILKDVHREKLAPFWTRDHFFMKDLHQAHIAHREICDEILTSDWVKEMIERTGIKEDVKRKK